MLDEVKPVAMPQIEAARARLEGLSLVSPLVACDASPAGKKVFLKLENLQPIGSFKIRPIGSAVLARAPADLSPGIYTTSTGNSALGLAWMARRLGIAATAVVPVNAPEAKLEKLRRLGARIDVRPIAEWWRAIQTGALDGQEGVYIDAVRDPASLAGDATIGLEILAQAPDIEAILIPFGGGGLSCGIACAVRAIRRDVKIIACELASAHPVKAAFDAGAPTETQHEPGFVSGVGFSSVLPEMWPLVKTMIDDVITVSLTEVAAAIKTLVEHNRVVAEGAGAVSVAAALSGRYAETKVCAVVSGGNLDSSMLATILEGRTPS
ncbi:MAG TPA: pyridoxal-phosphate dependent enzyme [Steroidobacteraceae bacterium]|jgi:threonine dehydratase